MTEKDKPAFPFDVNPDFKWTYNQGLTKREYFAAMAMQALLSNPHPDVQSMNNMAKASVDWADDLIKELNNNS